MRLNLRGAVALVLCCTPCTLFAQTNDSVRVKLTCKIDIACEQKYNTKPNQPFYEELPVPHRTADKAFWAWTAISIAATIADGENTMYVLSKPNTHEQNPIFGQHPNRLRYYSIAGGITAIQIPFMYKYKREDDALRAAGLPTHKYVKWWLLPVVNAGSHVLGVGITIYNTGR